MEETYYLTLLLFEEEGKWGLQVAGMTLEMVTKAMSHDAKKVVVRMPVEALPKGTTKAVMVAFDIFDYVRKVVLGEEGNRKPIELCDDCGQKYLVTLASLEDGRFVRILLTKKTVVELIETKQSQFVTDYRTRFYLGDNIRFLNFWIDLQEAKALEGSEYYTFSEN